MPDHDDLQVDVEDDPFLFRAHWHSSEGAWIHERNEWTIRLAPSGSGVDTSGSKLFRPQARGLYHTVKRRLKRAALDKLKRHG